MNTTAIAQHLNVLESAITEVQEWAQVLWVRVKGLGARFVSKRVVVMDKEVITGREFAEKIVAAWNATHGSEWNQKAAGFIKASIWGKKAGEIRVYFGSVKEPLTLKKNNAGKCGFNTLPTKYGIDALLKPIIGSIASQYTTQGLDRVLMQEDEDGIIAPLGQHEPGVAIVREWYENV